MKTFAQVAVTSGSTGNFRLGPFVPGTILCELVGLFSGGAGQDYRLSAALCPSRTSSVTEGDALGDPVTAVAPTGVFSQFFGLGVVVSAERPWLVLFIEATGVGNLSGPVSVRADPPAVLPVPANRKVGGKRVHFARGRVAPHQAVGFTRRKLTVPPKVVAAVKRR